MKKLVLLLVGIIVSSGNASNDTKVKDICKWHHEELIGWHESLVLFRNRYIKVSDKTTYPDTDEKTIERMLIKQKKLIKAIENSEKKIQTLSRIYHYLECSRFERKFEKSR